MSLFVDAAATEAATSYHGQLRGSLEEMYVVSIIDIAAQGAILSLISASTQFRLRLWGQLILHLQRRSPRTRCMPLALIVYPGTGNKWGGRLTHLIRFCW